MDKKVKILISVMIIIVIVLLICICFFKKDNNQKNTVNPDVGDNFSGDVYEEVYVPEELAEPVRLDVEKEFNGLQITNIELQMITERECELRATAYNPTDKLIDSQTIRIKVYDENGELDEIFGAQLSSVPAKDSRELSALIRKDITKASDIELEVID